ncbi:hypothetical protein EDD37DRAFT_250930 [Exophiala viscosa]|uniref:Uncharacterized protein n=1 Tax=Exophiala viscosa TaxID=2486360 RepID=A0AAN6E697_9EURO|nr:hypothetical protein EDD36DRAFT_459647 [Exophiala viscosa]KAI1627116.1 hypothetical protein EDD37DRAFT_250930 [Exophiala viscosa]
MSSTDVKATLFYLKHDTRWQREKPYTLFVDVSNIPGAENTNIEKEAVGDIVVRDARSSPTLLTLDVHGFEVMRLSEDVFKPESFEDPVWTEANYYPFLCKAVQQALGAKEVRVYEHKVRYRFPGFGDLRLRSALDYDPPIPQVHADLSHEYGLQLFTERWPEGLISNRLQVINIWRPLNIKVTEWPIALCSCSSVDREVDLQRTDQVKRLKGSSEADNKFVVMESYTSFYNSAHQWWYLKDQCFNEAWIIKLFDSKAGVAENVLHTAIDIGQSPDARKSIETRMMVVY